MTGDDFRTASVALLGSALHWQHAIADRLDIDVADVRQWLDDGQVPPWVEDRLAELIGARDISPRPRDDWVIGYAVTADPEELPADVTSGVVYATDIDTVLCEVAWFDPTPAPAEITRLMEAAADAIDRISDADDDIFS